MSDFDAVLVRLGAGYRHDAIEAFGELAADVLVGGGAPSFARSPLHVSIGGRVHTSSALQIEAVIDVAASTRGAVGNGDTVPFYTIDPRFTLRAGVTYRFAPGEATTIDNTGEPTFGLMWTLLRLPCLTLPHGSGPTGMPLGIQLIAPSGCDAALFRCAEWVTRALGRS